MKADRSPDTDCPACWGTGTVSCRCEQCNGTGRIATGQESVSCPGPEAATEDGPTFSICATHRPQVPGCPRCYPSLVDFLLVIHPSTSGDDGSRVCATCVDSGTPTPYPCETLQAAAHFTSPVPTPSGLQRATEQDRLRATLTGHYLVHIICDHERKLDCPVCSCSAVDLGWHESVGGAVEAWADHVTAVAVGGSDTPADQPEQDVQR